VFNQVKNLKQRIKRKKRIRRKIFGTAVKPRLCVFRSNMHIYAQVINDEEGKTLVASSDISLGKSNKKNTKTDQAHNVGKKIGEVLKKIKINTVVFDRSGYKYHGRVKSVCDGVRESGITV
jgi:large subunit ribosomal protein L18